MAKKPPKEYNVDCYTSTLDPTIPYDPTQTPLQEAEQVVLALGEFSKEHPLWQRQGVPEFLYFMYKLAQEQKQNQEKKVKVNLLDPITPPDGKIRGNWLTKSIWRRIRKFENDVGFAITEGNHLLPVFAVLANAVVLRDINDTLPLRSDGSYAGTAIGYNAKVASDKLHRSGRPGDTYDEFYDLVGAEGPDFKPERPKPFSPTEPLPATPASTEIQDRVRPANDPNAPHKGGAGRQ